MDEKGLGQRLQAARLAADLTQQALCQKANLSYSTLTKIERGAIKSPSIFTIQSIASALGTSLDTLIGAPSPAPAGKQRQRSKTGVSFVYFDVNGCLVRFFHRAFTRIAHDSGQTADVIESAFWHYNDQVCRGEMSMDDFNAALAERLQVPTFEWQPYYLEAVEPLPEMHELLAWASELYGVGLLTNIMPGLLDGLRQKGFLPDVTYDAIIDSSVEHAIKPEVKIYEIAAERAGHVPNELLLIDDSRVNLMAAEKVGWHVLWFDDYRPNESISRIRETLAPNAAPIIVERTTPDLQAAVSGPSPSLSLSVPLQPPAL